MKYFLYFLLFLALSCQSVKLIKNQDLVSESFLSHLRSVKSLSANGNNEQAWNKLGELNTWNLNDTENALADNLRGSILFKANNLEKAKKYFERALESATKGSEVEAQVKLNLATLYFKEGNKELSWNILEGISGEALYESEREKFYIFHYKVASSMGIPARGLPSLIKYFERASSYREVIENPVSQHLIVEFSKLPRDQQEEVLRGIQAKNFSEPLLIQKYLNEYMYLSNSSFVSGLISKLKLYESDPNVQTLRSHFDESSTGSQALDSQAIGLVIPLSGKMARFGKSVLKGIDVALFDIYGEAKPKVFVEDSHSNNVASRLAVKKLIEEHKVSYIIGGVFTQTASDEYLEAKKYGTLFFSLSPIYLNFAEKNSILFEVFGSIESQVAELLSEESIERNGKNFVMVYPETEAGRTYYKEVLRQAPSKNAVLVDAISFTPNQNNYQETVKKLLGVGYYKKYLSESATGEFKDLTGESKFVYVPVAQDRDKDGKSQILSLNYKWAYVPALPNDALQIIPSFRYFEARGLSYFGGPSWETKTFLERHIGLGSLYFIAGQNSVLQKRFSRIYQDRFSHLPGVVEEMAYESVSLGKRLMEAGFSKRSELINHISTLKFLEGYSSSWHKEDGIWFKDMDTYKINDRSVEKAY